MDPQSSVARIKGKEVVTTDVEGLVDAEGLDEESVVDNTCKAVIDYMLLPYQKSLNPYIMKVCRLNPLEDWAHSDRFLAFCKKYRSKFDEFMETYSRVGVFDKEDVLPHPSDKTSQIAAVDDVLDTYKKFKRFEILNGPPDNLFSDSKYGVEEILPNMARKIHHEWENFEKCLKDSDNIYVRAYKSKMDILTAVIIGNKGTPYHDGLFFIDVIFREHFPIKPPLFRLRSFGYAINPHMFECGEVRLNLSRQWTLPDGQIWVPFVTSLYDLLVNIRDKVLNADPLFLQPGFVECGASVVSEYFSFLYNENVLIKSLKIMTCIMNEPPKNFEAFVIGHFRNRAKDIMKECRAYEKGLKAGNGQGNNGCCCSHEFSEAVTSCIPELINSFNKIGATFDDVAPSLTLADQLKLESPRASNVDKSGLPTDQLKLESPRASNVDKSGLPTDQLKLESPRASNVHKSGLPTDQFKLESPRSSNVHKSGLPTNRNPQSGASKATMMYKKRSFPHVAAWEVARRHPKWVPVDLVGMGGPTAPKKRGGPNLNDKPDQPVDDPIQEDTPTMPRRKKSRDSSSKGNEAVAESIFRIEEAKLAELVSAKLEREHAYMGHLKTVERQNDLKILCEPHAHLDEPFKSVVIQQKREICERWGWEMPSV